jgi:hypothetical protein
VPLFDGLLAQLEGEPSGTLIDEAIALAQQTREHGTDAFPTASATNAAGRLSSIWITGCVSSRARVSRNSDTGEAID